MFVVKCSQETGYYIIMPFNMTLKFTYFPHNKLQLVS